MYFGVFVLLFIWALLFAVYLYWYKGMPSFSIRTGLNVWFWPYLLSSLYFLLFSNASGFEYIISQLPIVRPLTSLMQILGISINPFCVHFSYFVVLGLLTTLVTFLIRRLKGIQY